MRIGKAALAFVTAAALIVGTGYTGVSLFAEESPGQQMIGGSTQSGEEVFTTENETAQEENKEDTERDADTKQTDSTEFHENTEIYENTENYENTEQEDDTESVDTKETGNAAEEQTDEDQLIEEQCVQDEAGKAANSYGTIPTADTSQLIDISLYDYEENHMYSDLYFKGDPGWGYPKYNRWVGNWGYSNDCTAVQGIMDQKLYRADGSMASAEDHYEGYPVVTAAGRRSYTNAKGGLLSDETRVASGLNHLFTKSEDGYYSYDSAANYAYYDTSDRNTGKNFVVYNTNKGGNFMPLQDITEEQSWYYGMTVGFNFIQPKDGKTAGQDMTFSFSGDDDVWVFVDGQLVLDLGGIHGRVAGSINFATGAVNVDGVASEQSSGLSGTLGKTTSLQKLFSLDGQRFLDYSEHRLEFIYLERGANVSNCSLKFNLPPIPKNSLKISKQVTGINGMTDSNDEFSFVLYLEKEEEPGSFQPLPEGTGYQLLSNGIDTGVTGTVRADGSFSLKNGQTAVFSDIPENLNYYVEERNVSRQQYDQIQIVDGTASYFDENGNPIERLDNLLPDTAVSCSARSEIRQVKTNTSVIVQNHCVPMTIYELPEAGGIGFLWYLTAAVPIGLGAACILYNTRRMTYGKKRRFS